MSRNNANIITCDSCEQGKGWNVKVYFATRREKSKCLRLYCTDCRENKFDRLKEISKLLYKLQKQVEIEAKNEDALTSFTRQLKLLEM